MNLIIINYSMSAESQVFAHQPKIAKSLALHFDKTFVITAEELDRNSMEELNHPNLSIYSTNWIQGQDFRNLFRFYKVALPIVFTNRGSVLFSHMTELHSLFIAPFCKLLRIKHYLWYAHKSRSLALYLVYFFLEALITSSKGSCPITWKKVEIVGQAIDIPSFSLLPARPSFPPLRWYHIGRIDPSKNVHLLINSLEKYAEQFPELTLDLYGGPSTELNRKYYDSVVELINEKKANRWVRLLGPIPHSKVPQVANEHDAFIHAFDGSLDKSLLEAIASERFVVSSNPEYQKIFRNHLIENVPNETVLNVELCRFFSNSDNELNQEVHYNLMVLKSEHSLENWLSKVLAILNKGGGYY